MRSSICRPQVVRKSVQEDRFGSHCADPATKSRREAAPSSETPATSTRAAIARRSLFVTSAFFRSTTPRSLAKESKSRRCFARLAADCDEIFTTAAALPSSAPTRCERPICAVALSIWTDTMPPRTRPARRSATAVQPPADQPWASIKFSAATQCRGSPASIKSRATAARGAHMRPAPDLASAIALVHTSAGTERIATPPSGSGTAATIGATVVRQAS